MKRTRHSPAQIIGKLRDADGMLAAGRTIGEVCQALGISEPTFQRWRHQYGGMKAEEAKRLKELEAENSRLKKLLAEAELDKAILKEALEGNGRVLHAGRRRSFACGGALESASDGRAGCWDSRDKRNVTDRRSRKKKAGWSSGCWRWCVSIRATGIGGSGRCSSVKAGQ